MRKKYCVWILFSVLLLGLCACGNEKENSTENSKISIQKEAEEKFVYEGFDIFPSVPRPDEILAGCFGSLTTEDEMTYSFPVLIADGDALVAAINIYLKLWEQYGFTIERGAYGINTFAVTKGDKEIALIGLAKDNETSILMVGFFYKESELEEMADVYFPKPDGTLFSQLTFDNISLKTGKINDSVYARVTNHSNVVITGTIYATIYYNGDIVDQAILFISNDGLAPGDSVVISGIVSTLNGLYDDIELSAGTLLEVVDK